MTNTLSRKHRTSHVGLSAKLRSELAQGAMQDGIDDYCAGVPVQLCPYQRRAYRRAWLKGWHQMDRTAVISGAWSVTLKGSLTQAA